MQDSALANFDKAIAFTTLAQKQFDDIESILNIKLSLIKFKMHKALLYSSLKDYQKDYQIYSSIDAEIQKDINFFALNPSSIQTILLFYINYLESLFDSGIKKQLDETIKKVDFQVEHVTTGMNTTISKWYYHYIYGNYFFISKNYAAAVKISNLQNKILA